jgi:hypothetical protein
MCDRLIATALRTSGVYYDLMRALEAAHISSESESILMDTRIRMDKALDRRDHGIRELYDHRLTHAKATADADLQQAVAGSA